MFHLTTHAAFKALLFLGAGSVIHACHTNNVWEMGGLGKKMPVTAITFFIATLALAGIFPLAGFWSKDEILLTTLNSGHIILYIGAVATAFMTAFYMSRIFLLTFTGKTAEGKHPHESPLVMTIPLMILALLSITAGFIGMPGMEKNIHTFLSPEAHAGEASLNMNVAVSSNLVALAGIALASLIYFFKVISAARLRSATGVFYTLLKNKYYIDEFYMFLIRHVVFVISRVIAWFDRHIVDGAVNLAAFLCRWSGNTLRYSISGEVQRYALIIFGGLVAALLALLLFAPDLWRSLGGL
jgi:NADH-quinone oxidoreductase subunit L